VDYLSLLGAKVGTKIAKAIIRATNADAFTMS